ncbi:SusC/RagA family TonB-linked outer membrane protein [Larkinella soli]|uniref:SusC/RagA family TonB-linked outer membrane protein n=1 Tax=Larkinella soli TaxID=1770527 RepID=UPI000FFCAB57|nr:SusC/RagA family TonB-linked outer membrane protein [Larkinella soli]
MSLRLPPLSRLTQARIVLGWLAVLACPPVFSQTLASAHPLSRQEAAPVIRQLRDVLEELRTFYNVDILYEDKAIKGFRVVAPTYDRSRSVEQMLEQILQTSPLRFSKIKEGAYLIQPARRGRKPAGEVPAPKDRDQTLLTVPDARESSARALTAEAPEAAGPMVQQMMVQGVVTAEETGDPLPGVSVVVKGLQRGTTTDGQGAFQLSVPDDRATLVFSFIGYETQEVAVGNRSRLAVALKADIRALNEVVVIGYGQKERKNLTSAVSQVSGETIQNIPLSAPDQLLQGRASGLQISSSSGVPGSGNTVRIRGTSSFSPNSPASQPLYVIDGVFVNNVPLGTSGYGTEQQIANPLADLNPADIASMEVLKDANATSIYGSRGANGVVIITTKRGNYNAKPKISIGAYTGVSKAWRLPQITNGPQTAQLLNEAWQNDIADGVRPAGPLPYPNPESVSTYDRLPLLFRSAPTTSIDASLTGGDKNTSFFIGGSWFKQQGILRPYGFERATGRLNIDQIVNPRLKISTSNTVATTFRRSAPNDNSVGVMLVGLGAANMYPLFNSDGSYNYNLLYLNPVAMVRELDETSRGLRLISNTFGEYEIARNFFFRTSWSIDYNQAFNANFDSQLRKGPGNVATGYEDNRRNTTWINEQTLRYRWVPTTDHDVNFLVGNTAQRTSFRFSGVSGSNYPNDDLRNISSAAVKDGYGGETANTLLSFFGRVDYGYKGRYLIDVNMRADASSRFGANNRWGYFPSVGVAWRIIDEEFMKGQKLFSNLKLRTSWGITGSQETISEYAAQGLWTGGANYRQEPGTVPSQLANPDLKWEQTRQWNLGLDAGLLQNRLNVELNVYNKFTTGVLINKPVPMSTGFSTIAFNGGDISNKGVELGINAGIIRGKEFTWDAGLNISRNVNRIVKLDADYFEPFSRKFIVFRQGYPVNSFWLWKQTGVNPETGDAQYEDVDKDGQITDNDRLLLGSNQPDFYGGFNTTLKYKGFDLNGFFNFEVGQEIVNWSTFFMVSGGTRRNNANGQATFGFYTQQLDRWQKPGDVTDTPRMGGKNLSSNYGRFTSRAMEDGSYLRLKNLSLGYTLPRPLLTRLKMNTVRVYVMGTNLLTFTKYSGLDPEINAGGGKGTVGGVEMFTVPQPRTVQGGINLSF